VAGAYDAIETADALAGRLSSDLGTWSADKHLRVVYRPASTDETAGVGPGTRPRDAATGAAPVVVIETAPRRGGGGPPNYGFQKAEILDGNIGLLEIRAFRPEPQARAVADAAISFLAGARALIVDLRRNTGGSPEMVRYVASYMFDPKPVLLNRFFDRPSNTTTEQWTLDSLPGPRLPRTPLYIVTSARTFSAGEAFAYSLKHLGRAVVVGETTAGGAHPTADITIGANLVAIVPVARSEHPSTGTDWEGEGVHPDIRTTAAEALDAARAAALERIGASF
jgi:C-terminal processing protease CtpA/Prc